MEPEVGGRAELVEWVLGVRGLAWWVEPVVKYDPLSGFHLAQDLTGSRATLRGPGRPQVEGLLVLLQ